MKIRNNMGPRTLPWGSSSLDREGRSKGSVESHISTTRGEEVSNPRMELALYSIGRQFGEQGGMPD